jgi:uncharacterized protein (DUF885 family)
MDLMPFLFAMLSVAPAFPAATPPRAAAAPDPDADARFDALARDYLDRFPAFSPVGATHLGDHRFDGALDDVLAEARERIARFEREVLDRLEAIRVEELSRDRQVDHLLLRHRLRAAQWHRETLQEWAWNPLVYTRLAGDAVYGLLARDFAPLPDRLARVADRLEAFPRLFEQVRATLVPARVPREHAETAVEQNRGLRSLLDSQVVPHLGALPPDARARLEKALAAATEAVARHQAWLGKELLPKAAGDFRLGADRYDAKLAFALPGSLTRPQIRERAATALREIRAEMYRIAIDVYRTRYPRTEVPAEPTEAWRQAIIRACLEMAGRETPAPDTVVDCARRSLEQVTDFVRRKDLVTLPADPVEIIVMPEFQRGVSAAYCDAPGPLDRGQKTFYAVSPIPSDWTPEQVQSHLREYNLRSLHDLSMHEGVPGHYLQLAAANRHPDRLRAVLASAPFIEGWAVYGEAMMIEEGFLDGDPLMKLVNRKWQLRSVANALLDVGVHTEGMTREAALKLMMEDTFQEEREAAAKWRRAQLTAAQLPVYFVGFLEHQALRREAEQAWGSRFRLKEYHDRLLSFGSPPVSVARALLLDLPIPR